MLNVDHSDIDGPPLTVKYVRKFGSALDGEVTSLSVCVCVCVCVCVRACARARTIYIGLVNSRKFGLQCNYPRISTLIVKILLT